MTFIYILLGNTSKATHDSVHVKGAVSTKNKATMSKKEERIALFLDFENFSISYQDKFGTDSVPFEVFDQFINHTLQNYKRAFSLKNINCVGVWVCIGMGYKYEVKNPNIRKTFQQIGRLNGFIITQGHRDADGIKEKGVDTEIVCQMLLGAFRDAYDTAILFSDDADFIPAVLHVQSTLGKKVVQAGFLKNSKLRSSAHSHLRLELATPMLELF